MKIAFVNQPKDVVLPPNQNSIGIWTYEVARRLARTCDVIVYTGTGHIHKKAEYIEDVCYRYACVRPDQWTLRLLKRLPKFCTAKRHWFATGLYYLGYILQVAHDLRAQKCDIVHLFNLSQFAPTIRTFNPNIKIILNMTCEWLSYLDQQMIERRLKKVDMVTGCSEYITEETRSSFPQFAHHCFTAYNGVDVNHFVSRNGQGKAQKRGRKRLLFVGRVSPEKGVHILLEAFKLVTEQYPGVQLEIVGLYEGQLPIELIISLSDDAKVSELLSFYTEDSDTSYFCHLQKQLHSLGIVDQVTFSGSVPYAQVVNHYQRADVLINPSFSESFGRSLIEAMACSIPVVASRVGGMPESVTNGKTGLLVESGDTSGLAEAIIYLLENDDLRKSMGKEARKRVVERFSWERIVENLSYYHKIICERNE